jgi:hypothetical protein
MGILLHEMLLKEEKYKVTFSLSHHLKMFHVVEQYVRSG